MKQIGTQAGLNAYDDDHDESPYFRVYLGHFGNNGKRCGAREPMEYEFQRWNEWFFIFLDSTDQHGPAAVRQSRRLPTYKAPAPTIKEDCSTAGRFCGRWYHRKVEFFRRQSTLWGDTFGRG